VAAVPLTLPGRRGLVAHATACVRDKYLGSVFHDLTRGSRSRLDLVTIRFRPESLIRMGWNASCCRHLRRIEKAEKQHGVPKWIGSRSLQFGDLASAGCRFVSP